MFQKKGFGFFFALFSALFLVSCSSAHKRAEKLLEGGAYEEAESAYREILQGDPKDSDAVLGLRLAREKVIDTHLIQVRLSRLAGNGQNSLDLLLRVVSKENEWAYYPKGAVGFTQEEESRFASEYLTQKIERANEQGFPLQSFFLLKKYRPIFEGVLIQKHVLLSEKVNEKGRAQCYQLASWGSAHKPYFLAFVDKVCGLWSVEQKGLSTSRREMLKDLFSKVNLRIEMEGISKDLSSLFQDAFQARLSGSAWYDPKAENEIEVVLTGSYFKDHRTQTVQQAHQYLVQVPYTAFEPVTRTREIPYLTTESECQFSPTTGQVCRNVPVTRYRTEYYIEDIPVTRYQSVPKVQSYEAIQHHQVLSFSSKGDGKLDRLNVSFSLTEKSKKEGFEHHWNMPNIGLRPQDPGLQDELEWLKMKVDTLSGRFQKSISDLWDSLYCKPTKESSLAASGEQVHRCLRNHPSDAPEFVKKWYENKLGISVENASEILRR